MTDGTQDEFIKSVFGVDVAKLRADGANATVDIGGDASGRVSRRQPHRPVPPRVAQAPGPTEDQMKEMVQIMKIRDGITVTFDVAAEDKAFGAAILAVNADRHANPFDPAKFQADLKTLKGATDRLKAAADKVPLKARQKSRDDLLKRIADLNKGGKLDDLTKIPPQQKAQMIDDLLGAGEPNPDQRMNLELLYVQTPLDSGFETADKKHQQETADKLKGDKDLIAARQNWKNLDPKNKAQDSAKMLTSLQRIADAQSDTFGIKHVPVVDDSKKIPKGDFALFSDDDDKIYVDLQKQGMNDFAAASEAVLHENAHHWQHELVKKLEAKQLKPTDPLFNEARLFQANERRPGGYIKPPPDPKKDDQAQMDEIAYERQPVELHAIKAGKETAQLLDAALQAASPSPPPATGGQGSNATTPPPAKRSP